MRRDRLTPEELSYLFGADMPVEALLLIEKGLKLNWSTARLRVELYALAGKPIRREDLDRSGVREWRVSPLLIPTLVLVAYAIALMLLK